MRELTYSQPKPRYVKKKPGFRARVTAKKRRAEMKGHGAIREYVFEREQGICRCCRLRKAESMHEIVFRSAGGKVSKRNSIAVCGTLVGTERCCHTYLQQNEIEVVGDSAEDLLQFWPKTQRAADWMRIGLSCELCSMPGGRNEEMPA